MPFKPLPHFSYKFQSGPVIKSKLQEPIKQGNCRLAVQLYFYIQHQLYLPPEDVYTPKAYYETGDFIKKENSNYHTFFQNLNTGDVIYAEKIRNSQGQVIYKKLQDYHNKQDRIIYLHSAIYLGKLNKKNWAQLRCNNSKKNVTLLNKPLIWHATFIEKSTCFWTVDKFLQFYQPIAVKRIIN